MVGSKQQHERSIGDRFVTWLNEQSGKHFVFLRHTDRPDLVFQDGDDVLKIEVASAYYNSEHARGFWENARRKPSAPHLWEGMEFDDQLIRSVNQLLAEKSLKDYAKGCVLVIEVEPSISTAEDVEERLGTVDVPEACPFDAVYIAGDFQSYGGYRCWHIWPKD